MTAALPPLALDGLETAIVLAGVLIAFATLLGCWALSVAITAAGRHGAAALCDIAAAVRERPFPPPGTEPQAAHAPAEPERLHVIGGERA